MWMLLFNWLWGCAPSTLDSATSEGIPPLSEMSPRIVDFSWQCENDRWTVFVESDAWTGNGSLWLGNADRVEKHPIYSIAAGEFGESDLLRITLDVVSDWRDASPGSYTGWRCSQMENLSMLAAIYHPSLLTLSDCVDVGTDIWSHYSNLPDCRDWVIVEE